MQSLFESYIIVCFFHCFFFFVSLKSLQCLWRVLCRRRHEETKNFLLDLYKLLLNKRLKYAWIAHWLIHNKLNLVTISYLHCDQLCLHNCDRILWHLCKSGIFSVSTCLYTSWFSFEVNSSLKSHAMLLTIHGSLKILYCWFVALKFLWRLKFSRRLTNTVK